MEKKFFINLCVTQDKDGNYDICLEQMDFLQRSTLTSSELKSIREGCVLMAREMTETYRKEIFNI